MAMKRCNVCGEKYSDTYRDCPFCEEEEALREGEEIRRNVHRGKRAAGGGRRFSLITPTLIVLILIMAGLLVYLLRDGDGGQNDPVDGDPTTDVTPGDSQNGVMPGDDVTEPDDGQSDDDDQTTDPEDGDGGDYDEADQLPDGLSLSSTDFTLRTLGESSILRASGGSGAYTWISQDEGIASVDQNGKVTAVSGGTTNVLVTDGSKKAVCIVRVTASGTLTTPDNSTTNSNTSGGSLRTGSATVINGGNGVRVRSGPGTTYEVLATVPNGAAVQVVKSSGDDWYEITFDGVGGVKTTGYMKGEFLQNS